jgi:hypothetical protein
MNFNIKKYLSLAVVVFCLGATLTACGENKTENAADAQTEATDKTETVTTQVEDTKAEKETRGKKDSKMGDSKSASEQSSKNDKKDGESKKKQIKELETQKLGFLPTDETNCPKNAPVKGKITKKNGDIYHLTDSENYLL